MLKKIVSSFFWGGDHEMEYLVAHGFRHGKNFHNNSSYPIDSNWPWLVSVGDDVTFASDVKILAHDASTCLVGAHTKIGKVIIGNRVFIGAGAIILCNIHIGDNVIVGAGSVVTHDLPSNGIYAGNPARLIYTFDEYCEKEQKSLAERPYFNQRRRDDWANASPEEWEEMRKQLDDEVGYV